MHTYKHTNIQTYKHTNYCIHKFAQIQFMLAWHGALQDCHGRYLLWVKTYRLWLRHEPLPSLALHFGTNSLIWLAIPFKLASHVPLFILSRLLSSPGVSHTGYASDWRALREALNKCIDKIQHNTDLMWASFGSRSPIIPQFHYVFNKLIVGYRS